MPMSERDVNPFGWGGEFQPLFYGGGGVQGQGGINISDVINTILGLVEHKKAKKYFQGGAWKGYATPAAPAPTGPTKGGFAPAPPVGMYGRMTPELAELVARNRYIRQAVGAVNEAQNQELQRQQLAATTGATKAGTRATDVHTGLLAGSGKALGGMLSDAFKAITDRMGTRASIAQGKDRLANEKLMGLLDFYQRMMGQTLPGQGEDLIDMVTSLAPELRGAWGPVMEERVKKRKAATEAFFGAAQGEEVAPGVPRQPTTVAPPPSPEVQASSKQLQRATGSKTLLDRIFGGFPSSFGGFTPLTQETVRRQREAVSGPSVVKAQSEQQLMKVLTNAVPALKASKAAANAPGQPFSQREITSKKYSVDAAAFKNLYDWLIQNGYSNDMATAIATNIISRSTNTVTAPK